MCPPNSEVNMEAGGGEFGSSAEDFVAMQKPERFVTVVAGRTATRCTAASRRCWAS